eukprot:NODE_16_length_3652_cov_77.479716_g7_i0.p1 GENE.NODE_16_length_3652_cov_77.479716_g7_i0~~NODE_16_length_3652_cov_77.479716_g7_i0.p1  ORF type:complete len:1127 (-),score=197.30 NODE_16_length_3652_cov_77.479716_g7_i0:57-3437(-)
MPPAKYLHRAMTEATSSHEDTPYEAFLTEVDVRELPPIQAPRALPATQTPKPHQPTGFDRLNFSLKKILGRMDGDLDEKWKRVSRYMEAFHVGTDTHEAAKQLREVYMYSAKLSAKLPTPNTPMTAVACAILDHVLYWYGEANPLMMGVGNAVRQLIYRAVFAEELDSEPKVLKNDQINTAHFEATSSRYMRQTFFDIARKYESQLTTTTNTSSEMSDTITRLQNEVDYWREAYKQKIFTAWRATANQQLHLKKERNRMTSELQLDAQKMGNLQREVEMLRAALSDEKHANGELRHQINDLSQANRELREANATQSQNVAKYLDMEDVLTSAREELVNLQNVMYEVLTDVKGRTDRLPAAARSALHPPMWGEDVPLLARYPTWDERLLTIFNTIMMASPGGHMRVDQLTSGPGIVTPLLHFLHAAAPLHLDKVTLDRVLLSPVAEKVKCIMNTLKSLRLPFIPLNANTILQEREYDLEIQTLVALIAQRVGDPVGASSTNCPALAATTAAARHLDAFHNWSADEWREHFQDALSASHGSRIGTNELVGGCVGRALGTPLAEEIGGVEWIAPPKSLYMAALRLGTLTATTYPNAKDTRASVELALGLIAGVDVVTLSAIPDDELLKLATAAVHMRDLAGALHPVTVKGGAQASPPAEDVRKVVLDAIQARGGDEMGELKGMGVDAVLKRADQLFHIQAVRTTTARLRGGVLPGPYVAVRAKLVEYIAEEEDKTVDEVAALSDSQLLEIAAPMLADHSGRTKRNRRGPPTPAASPTVGAGQTFKGDQREPSVPAQPSPEPTGSLTPPRSVTPLENRRGSRLDDRVPLAPVLATNPEELEAKYLTKVRPKELADILSTGEADAQTECTIIKGALVDKLVVLNDIYRYYASASVGHWTMNMQELWRFAKDCKIVNLRDGDSRRLVADIFARSNANNDSGVIAEDDNDNELTPAEWMEAVVRFAHSVVHKAKLSDKVLELVDSYILRHGKKTQINEFKEMVYRPEVQKVLKKHRKKLTMIFKHYCRRRASRFAMDTEIDLEELRLMAKEGRLLDKRFTYDEIKEVFIFVQEDQNAALNLYEFMEALVAIAAIKHPAPFKDIGIRVEFFLEEQFLPVLVPHIKQGVTAASDR